MTQVNNRIRTSCYHCGESCNISSICIADKFFCCSGCKMVYEILNKNSLCIYYDLNENPGVTQRTKMRPNKFSFMEDEQVIAKLIQFTDGTQTRVSFYLPQMHCSSCIWLLENLHKLNPEIIGSMVDFPKKEITVVYKETKTSLRELAELLSNIGYEPHINLADLDERKVNKVNRSRLFKLGIAGFCFGNIMMLSFPEYLSSGIYYQEGMRELFSYLILALSLPVFFYCASEFYTSAWKGLKQKFLNIDAPIALAILITFSRSIYEILYSTGSGYLDSMSGIVFFMLVGRTFQDKVYNSISFERDYKSYFPIAVAVKKEGKEENIPVSKLKIGDRIVVRNQELIPADSILFFGKAKIDYSFVTGEAMPIEKSIGEIVYAGGKQKGTAIELEVVKEVSQSYLTQLWNNKIFNQNEEKQGSFIHKLSRNFSLLLFSIAAITGIYWWIEDSSKILNALTSVLIVACSCSILLSATFTYGNILRIFGKNKFFVKNASVIEALATADTIVFDKTGTLTQNEFSDLSYEGRKLNSFEEQLVRSIAGHSKHALSQAIFNNYPQHELLPVENFSELPGQGIEASILGISVRLGSETFILNKNQVPASSSKVFVEINHKMKGNFLLKSKYREGFIELVNNLRQDYGISLLSGDNSAEQNYLQFILGEKAELLFWQSPEDKLNYIATLQAKDKKVIMVGDGLNDAGALRKSNVGIALNDNNNNFSPACDAMLEASNFG